MCFVFTSFERKAKTKYRRAYKAKPVTVAEYIKSWIYGVGQRIERSILSWKTVRKKESRRSRTGSSGRNYRSDRYRLIKGTHLRSKRFENNATRLMCMSAVMAMSANQWACHAAARFDSDSRMIRVDNCASYSISNDVNDFIGDLKPINTKLKGLGGSLSDIKRGTIKWTIQDDNGLKHDLLLPNSLFVRESPSKLLSPQHWAQVSQDNSPIPRGTWCATYGDKVVLHWGQRKFKKTIKLDKSTGNVATIYTAPGYDKFEAYCTECGMGEEVSPLCGFDVNLVSDSEGDEYDDDGESRSDSDDENIMVQDRTECPKMTFDLDPVTVEQVPQIVEYDEDIEVTQSPMTELLRWHQALGHVSMTKLQRMAEHGILPKRLAKCEVPMCTSCLYGKAVRRSWRNKPKKVETGGKLRTATSPGQCVSVDQIESAAPGLIAQMKGWITTKRYRVATVFVDHYSGLSYVYFQKTTDGAETLEAKLAFERYADKSQVRVQSYQADNGRFAEKAFLDHAATKGQMVTYCGVNAHFQNGVAERRIRILQDSARTMLLHAKHRWPNAIDNALWPYALRCANDVTNVTSDVSRKDRKSPLELFTGSDIRPNLSHHKVFGCPVYVLDETMQAGQKLPKWDARARVGVNLGLSPQHARTVALVLNLKTGRVTPQFHVKFDTKFDTVKPGKDNVRPESLWQQVCGFKDDKHEVAKVSTRSKDKTSQKKVHFEKSHEVEVRPITTNVEEPPVIVPEGERHEMTQEDELLDDVPQVQVRRSTRQKTPSRYEREGLWTAMQAKLEHDYKYYVAYETIHEWNPESEEMHPMQAYAASADPDTMYYHEAMKEPDRKQFIKAMQKEVESHTSNGVWELVPKSSVPKGMEILPSVWAMKRKRRIATREVYKWKARLNIDGSKQTEGVNYWDTFSPVASWAAIRMVLITALLNEWETRQVDFVLAYTQADVECELYMKIPKGFEVDDDDSYCLKLKRNLFGQKQAGRVWNQHLVEKLKSIGFEVSAIDECLFYRGNSLYVLYTDDLILTGPDPKELDEILNDMKSAGLDLTVEGDVSDFLGVQIDRVSDGQFRLTQPHLINDILKELRLDGDRVAIKKTPGASSVPLLRHMESDDFDGHFDYRRVIGKLNYLEKCTRPDISCAVHQAARFVGSPKVEHGKALKWLGRYLAGTKEQGIIYTPDNDQSFELYVDASFSGNWDPKDAEWDPDTARSRAGYFVMYAGCPVIWASKLLTEIAMSTTESEYLAISTATREVLPIMELIQEMSEHGYGLINHVPKVHCRVFEDNSGAVELASSVKNPKMRPRTKHINTKYHHFRTKVMDGTLSIHPISTDDMLADILTKNCNEEILTRLRARVIGW